MTYDTVVIGAGTAGCVVAARLLEQAPTERLLLLEAGHNSANKIAELATLGRIPEHSDWGLYGELNNSAHRLWLPRGKLVGGCSVIQGGIALRGFPKDYDRWAHVAGARWGYEAVLPVFKRMERDPFGGRFHGDSGPIPIVRSDRAMLQPFNEGFLDACESLGIKRCDDFNGPIGHGVGLPPLAGTLQSRANVRSCYLSSWVDAPQLTVVTGATVRKLHLDAHRVIAAEYIRGQRTEIAQADRFVLTSGAVGTPEILLRSGLGPEEDLKASALPVHQPLEGVGKVLRDHLSLWIAIDLARGHGNPNRSPWFQAMLRESADTTSALPDAMIEAFHDFRLGASPLAYRRAIITLGLLAPTSTGSVRLDRRSPEGPTVVTLGYPCASDHTDMLRLLRFADDVLASPVVLGMLSGRPSLLSIRSHGARLATLMPRTFSFSDRTSTTIDACTTTAHHLHGSCRMGADTDREAVVDSECRVHGFKNLFISDASVIPIPFRANTHLVTIMIAERVAEFLASS
jgi:choline dehydrogenase